MDTPWTLIAQPAGPLRGKRPGRRRPKVGLAVTRGFVLAAVFAAVGCGTPSPTSSPAEQASSSPVGLIAIGHSGLTGESSDPGRPGQDAKENSWATGTTPEVQSVYLRIVALRPETQDNVANSGEGGAVARQLAGQAEDALDEVPAPALAIIQTIDNDIRCDGTDSDHVAEFGSAVDEALQVITQASPKTRVLVVGQMGRPANAAAAIAEDPGSMAGVTGTGVCDFFDPSGTLVPSKLAALTAIIEGYEKEQARVCASYTQCSTDKGAFAAFIDTPATLVSGHLTIAGHTKAADLIWPEVQPLLP